MGRAGARPGGQERRAVEPATFQAGADWSRPRAAAPHGADRAAELLGGLGMGEPFQVAEHDGCAEPFRQSVQLVVEQAGKLGAIRSDLERRQRLQRARLLPFLAPGGDGPRPRRRGRRPRRTTGPGSCPRGPSRPCGRAPGAWPGRRRPHRSGRGATGGRRPGSSARGGSSGPRTPPRRPAPRTGPAARRRGPPWPSPSETGRSMSRTVAPIFPPMRRAPSPLIRTPG